MSETHQEARNLLGVDLGGTKTALVAGNSEGAVIGRVEFPTLPTHGYLDWLSRMQSALRNLQAVAGDWSPSAAGVSCGGPADWQTGRLLSPPNLPGWHNVPVRDDVSAVAGVPCLMEHDGRAGALAEHRFGAGRGCSDMVFLTFGTGIGAGIIVNGRIVRGASGASGEVGHVRISESGPVAYGKAGSLESFASGTGISRLAAKLFPGRWPSEPDARDIVDLGASGDPGAQVVLDASADKLGRGLALLADVLNPEVIVLGSLASRLDDSYLERAIDVMRSEALPGNFESCRVVRSELGASLQDVAALMVGLGDG